MPKKPLPTQPAPSRVAGDLLGCLGEQDGWDAAPGGGWQHKTLGITARQLSSQAFEVQHAGNTRHLTSATGALLVVDQLTKAAV